MVKLDLHTHSTASYDGGVSAQQYRDVLESGVLDCVAITDHNQIDFALDLHKELGNKVIVGEEIMTSAGEIIGLFLTKPVEPGLTPLQTVKKIKQQKGLVYIPHPFETVRKGMTAGEMDKIAKHIDIVEVINGRTFLQNRGPDALLWARMNHNPGAAGSDAHGLRGLGSTYSNVDKMPTRTTLPGLLKNVRYTYTRPKPRALLYPKYHRLRKKVRRKK